MELKAGYKQTEVGVIPEDWDVRQLSNISLKIMVGIASAATHAYRLSGIPMIRNQNIKPGHLLDSDLLFIDQEYEKTYRNKRLLEGDLLTTRTGYPGTTCIVPAKYKAAQSFTTLITRPDTAQITSKFLCLYINSEHGQRFFKSSQIGGAQKNVNTGTLQKMPIPIPIISEQTKVSNVLGAVEELLASIENLIAKKRALKQATMQELLTGKRRLPGFEGEWEVKRLGDLGEFLKGSGVKKDEATSGDLPCVRYGEIYTHHENYVREFKSHISTNVASRAATIRQGDILFAGSGETKEEIGKAIALPHPIKAFAGGDIVILRQQDSDALFLGYRLNAIDISRQKAGLGQGDAVVHISARSLSEISVSLPKREEQEAIAGILYEMDIELRQLQLHLAKIQSLKQGMMQQLLTGKIRLI
ncbi:MAG: restriction endonuclease subunit S [Cyanobacteriota bacterium]|jgi:type I restriction enzyme S subunit